MDSKHRVVIPDDVRKEFGIETGSRLKVSVRGHCVVLSKKVEPEEFIKRMEGAMKEGSKVERSDPIRLKRVWSAP